MEVIISELLDGDQELLIIQSSMFKLFLLPQNWPYRCDNTKFKTCNMDKDKVSNILEDLEKWFIDICLRTKAKEGKNHSRDMHPRKCD